MADNELFGNSEQLDLINRQAVIDTLNFGAELLRRTLDDADIVGAERAKYEWGLGLIESYISDIEELPSAQQWTPCTPETMPKVREWVLCQCRAGIMDVLRLTEDGDWNKNYPHAEYMSGFVIAWMPLPDPWKGGQE